jgi:hypothetical protein
MGAFGSHLNSQKGGHKDERAIAHLTPTLNSHGVITYFKVVITLQLDCQKLVAHIIVLFTPLGLWLGSKKFDYISS